MIRGPLVVLATCVIVTAYSAVGTAQCETPLTESALREMVAGGVPAARLRSLIASCGLDLGEVDAAATEARLKQIGVPAAALAALLPPATAAPGAAWTSPIDRRPMVFIPSGTFRMGRDATGQDGDVDEEGHQVAIANGFWLDVAEVTNEAFRRFVISRPEWQKENVSQELQRAGYLKNWQGTAYPEGRGELPVVLVSWQAARAYAVWAGKRLPTEAEWEYASRADSVTRFWWGDEFDPRRVVTDQKTAGLGLELRTNAWGVRDGTGSVWEWTSSQYRPYPYVATDGREDLQAPGPRSIRGGSRVNAESFLRSANRNFEETDRLSDLLGFRCAR